MNTRSRSARAFVLVSAALTASGCELSPTHSDSGRAPATPNFATAAAGNLTYDGGWAAAYGLNNAFRSYVAEGKRQPDDNPWPYYGNKCTIFVTQELIAGFLRTTSANDTWSKRSSFWADHPSGRGIDNQWWYNDPSNYGDASKSAQALYSYTVVQTAHPDWVGLHFSFVGKRSKGSDLDATKLRPGDVVFMDWNADNRADHVSMVSAIRTDNPRLSSYARIQVVQQSDPYLYRALSDVIENNKTQGYVNFYVYRPTFYKRS